MADSIFRPKSVHRVRSGLSDLNTFCVQMMEYTYGNVKKSVNFVYNMPNTTLIQTCIKLLCNLAQQITYKTWGDK